MEIKASAYNLYKNIEHEIEQNGGYQDTIVNIFKEWPELFGYNVGKRGVWVYNMRSAKILWSKAENDYIRYNWTRRTLKEIGMVLNRTREAISVQGYKLGLNDRPNLSGRPKKHKTI